MSYGQHLFEKWLFKDNNDGLSQNHVFDIKQDRYGFIWISTMGGLNKFDGFDFTSYVYNEEDSNSLSANWVSCFLEDSKGQFWVSTSNGFNNFNRKTGKFKRYDHSPNNPLSLAHSSCKDIAEDRKGNIWIVHSLGVDCFDPLKETFEHYLHPEFRHGRHSGSIRIDQQGDIWIGGTTGLYKVNLNHKSLDQYVYQNPLTGEPIEVLGMEEDTDGKIWICHSSGLSIFDKNAKKFEDLKLAVLNGGTHSILRQANGVMNIGTITDGLIRYDTKSKKIIQHYKYNPSDPDGLQGDNVYSLFLDRDQNIWVGLFNGLAMLPHHSNPYKLVQIAKGKNNIQNSVLMACDDSMGNFFVNTLKGLYFIDKNMKFKEEISFSPNKQKGYQELSNLFRDTKGNIYCTRYHYGLYKFNPGLFTMEELDHAAFFKDLSYNFIIPDQFNSDQIIVPSKEGIHFYNTKTKINKLIAPSKLNNNLNIGRISKLCQSNSGEIYFVLNKKLCRYQPSSNNLDILTNENNQNIEGNITKITALDSTIWVGTTHYVYQYNLNTRSIQRSDTLFYLPKFTNSMETDQYGNLWIGAGSTLYKYEPMNAYLNKYSLIDGKGLFNQKSYSYNGSQIYFCMSNGLAIVEPDHFKKDTSSPAIYLTEIKVLNKPYPTELAPEFVDKIKIDFHDKSLSIKFASNHFIRQSSISYYYKLESFDEAYINNENKREVIYTNLKPGNYIFQAYAMTEDGVKSKNPIRLEIEVTAPFYMTNLFYGTLLGLSILLISIYYRINQKSLELKKKNELIEKTAKYKTMFMANMSHEIRTPMNAIIGLNKLLLDTDLDKKQKQYLNAIQLSCENLLFIVNDILDQVKIESGKYSIVLKYFNIRNLLDQINTLLSAKAQEKNLLFQIQISEQIPNVLKSDPVRLFQILTNLINNAIKFTDTGSVLLDVRSIQNKNGTYQINFKVKDTGIGIPAAKLDTIFESFEQIHEKEIIGNQGTGLGLSISKHLVEILGGKLTVKSKHGEGSEFFFSIHMEAKANETQSIGETQKLVFKNSYKLLLVEDSPINQLVAIELIKKHMPGTVVDLAENGQIAIEKLNNNIYDLILMDVKMPVMDGIMATKLIRKDHRQKAQSIPIIGLTANAISQQITECLDSGMNDTVTKPIDPVDLFYKLKKQLEP
ncbi:MAG: response regulator [Saprospiraceae bacterium]|nr:response regulator [Saprospiraceae bacterium]